MHRSILATVLFFCISGVQAAHEGLVLNDLRAKNAVQLSADEMNQLMPNAKVVNYWSNGSTRRWTNEPGGKMVVNSDGCGATGTCRPGTAGGTWQVGGNGTYCITLEWRNSSENWCLFIFKVDEKYYGVRSASNGAAVAIGFEFLK